MILPYINYSLLSWGSKPDKIPNYKKELFEQSLVQFLSLTKKPLFKLYNILKVNDIFKYKLLTFYWKAKQAQLPKYLQISTRTV